MKPKDGSTAEFVRGWEVFGHSFHLLRLSIVRTAALAMVLGAGVGTAQFRQTLSPEARASLPPYAQASVRTSFSSTQKSRYVIQGASRVLANGEAYELLRREAFGGRSLTFLAKQWGNRLLLSWTLLGPAVALAARAFGRRSMLVRRLRGTTLRHPVEAAGLRRRRVLGLQGALALAGACLLVGSVVSFHNLADLPDYAVATAAQNLPSLAAWLGPEGDATLAWYSGPGEPGFRETASMVVYFRDAVFGVPLGSLLGLWFLSIVGLGGLAWGTVRVGTQVRAASLFQRGAAVLPKGWAPWRGERGLAGFRKALPASEPAPCSNTFTGGGGQKPAAPAGFPHPHPPLQVAGIPIEPGKECYHFLFCGSPGSGKSTAIKALLAQVRQRGQRAIVYDASGEYIRLFYRAGRDHILNPLDARGEPWTLWADVQADEDFTTMARSIFPPEGSEPYWQNAGAVLFAATARVLRDRGEMNNSAMYTALVEQSLDDLRTMLAGTAGERVLDRDAGAMPPNLMATVTTKVLPWSFLPDPPGKPFSIRQFVCSEDDRWLFLSSRQDQRAALKPLISLWCDIAANALLSLPENLDRRLWCVLDEVASLQRLTALEDLLDKGRKQGAAVVLGLQSMPQLQVSYGPYTAAALASHTQTWLVLRTAEPSTAQWLEQALGDAEVEETRQSITLGTQPGREGVSLQDQVRRTPVALRSEIMMLPDMHGFLKSPGSEGISRVQYSHTPRPDAAPAFVERGRAAPGRPCETREPRSTPQSGGTVLTAAPPADASRGAAAASEAGHA